MKYVPKPTILWLVECTQTETDKWVVEAGGEWEVQILIDEPRSLYAAWGLGESSTWYAVNPWTVWHAYKLGTGEGIWFVFFFSFSSSPYSSPSYSSFSSSLFFRGLFS